MSEAARRRVLITGGSGFIGTNAVERFRREGYDVVSTDVRPPSNPEHAPLFTQCDLLDADGLNRLIEELRPEVVLHLGARTDLHGTTGEDYAANTTGTRNLLEALAVLGEAPRLMVASSRMVCEIGYSPNSETDYRPPNAYGESKVATEEITRAFDYPGTWCIPRPTSIWGPWFGVPYRDFFLAVARGVYLHPRGVRVHKSFGYVGNSVYQLLKLAEAPAGQIQSKTFYMADYVPLEVGDWSRRIKARTGGRKLRSIPMPLLRAAARGGDLAKRLGMRESPITSFRLDNLVTEMIYDTSTLEAVAPDLPYDLDAGVEQTVAWMRANGNLAAAG